MTLPSAFLEYFAFLEVYGQKGLPQSGRGLNKNVATSSAAACIRYMALTLVEKVSKPQNRSPIALKAGVVHVKSSMKVVFVYSPTEATARISRLVTSLGKVTRLLNF
jgi:hypothetical protein